MSLTKDDRNTLLNIARDSIRFALASRGKQRLGVDPNQYHAALQEHRATFVTINIHGELRGCIGSLEARQPLVTDIVHNAHAAAFSDPRFAPLSESEFTEIDLHISILTPATPMSFTSEQDLIRQLNPTIDGLILQDGISKGTFLPSVWESLPEPEQFFMHLKRKAGLPVDYWSESLQVYRYTTDSFGETDNKP